MPERLRSRASQKAAWGRAAADEGDWFESEGVLMDAELLSEAADQIEALSTRLTEAEGLLADVLMERRGQAVQGPPLTSVIRAFLAASSRPEGGAE